MRVAVAVAAQRVAVGDLADVDAVDVNVVAGAMIGTALQHGHGHCFVLARIGFVLV